MPTTVRGPSAPSVAAPRPSTDTVRASPSSGSPPVALWRTVLTVAWLSVLLGFAIEALLLGLAAATGGLASPRPFVADLISKVSWSVVVCVGISLGTAVGRARPTAMGVLGLLSAPAGFAIAKTVQKGVSAALGLAAAAGGPSPWLVAGLKALQYGIFGTVTGKLSSRRAGLLAYALTGAATGVVLGGLLVALLARSGGDSAATIVARAVDEVAFPIGCALVLYVAENLTPAR
ncbi:MAG: hypothetical protein ACM3OB_02265 [Acidobacteriota bacterium]